MLIRNLRKIGAAIPVKPIPIALVALGLLSCANITHPEYFYKFDIDLKQDDSDAEMLDYQFGTDKLTITSFDRSWVALGKTTRAAHITGAMPKGEYVYIKWRNLETKRIYEDRVDLKSLLPKDLTKYGIHPTIREGCLSIYLIPPPGTIPYLYFTENATEGQKDWLKDKLIYQNCMN